MRLVSISTISLALLAVFWDPLLAGQAPVSMVKLASYHISKRAVHTVSDKFMSFTIDPDAIKQIPKCHQMTNATLNMARSLTPSYIRLAGPKSNQFLFQSNPNASHLEFGSSSHNDFPVSSAEWLRANEFFSKIGMNVIACVSGARERGMKNLDLGNILELITFSDKHNVSLDWQLGYELQRLAPSQGKIMGHDVARLRKILDVFPRYRDSLVIGPDMTSFNSRDDAAFVRNYLMEAADALNVFTWHPFNGGEENDIFEMLYNGMTTMDNYLWIKDGVLKSTSKGVVPKKSIWIAESEEKTQVSNLTDSMTWIRRMGAAARLGASVYLRKPHALSLNEPTSEYWVAVLFKSLVGKTVLDIKQVTGNGTNKIQMFSHCTQVSDKPEGGIINPMTAYERGSITVYGVNTGPESTRISFRVGLKGDETAHMYILSEDNSKDLPTTLLNKQPLGLSPENELPMVSPKIREFAKYLVIPGRSIFFVVFPEAKCRACHQQSVDQDSTKSQINVQEEDQETNTFTNNVMEVMEDENDHDAVYVSYPKRDENNKLKLPQFRDNDQFEPSDPSINVKYVTFSEDTWLSSFPEKMKEAFNKEKIDSSDKRDKSKAEKYRIFAQAMLGKRNVTATLPRLENTATRFVIEDDTSITNPFKRTIKNFGNRFKRSESNVTGSNVTGSNVTGSNVTGSNVTGSNELRSMDLESIKEALRATGNRWSTIEENPVNVRPFSRLHTTSNSTDHILETSSQPTISPTIASTSTEPTLQKNTTVQEIPLESENSTISRGYREVVENADDEVDDPLIGTTRTHKAGDKANFRPVSPFPSKKLKNMKSKPKTTKNTSDKLQMSHHNPKSQEIPSTSTQAVETTSILSSTALTPQDDVGVVHKTSFLFGRDTEPEVSESTTTAAGLQPSVEHVSSDLVSRPKPATDLKPENTFEKKIEEVHEKIVSLLDSIKSKHASKPVPYSSQKAKSDSKTSQNIAELLDQQRQKMKEAVDRKNARLEELRSRLNKPGSHLHKRELFEDLYNATAKFFSDTKQQLGEAWQKANRWLDGVEQSNRHRRDVDSETVVALRPTKSSTKNDDRVKRVKQQIEARRVEIKQKLQTLAEEQKSKKTRLIQNLPIRPKRDMQKYEDMIQHVKNLTEWQPRIKKVNHDAATRMKRDTQGIADLVRELKQAHKARRNDFIERVKQKKTNRLTPTRPKRDTQRIADLVRELKQAHEARRNDFIERVKQKKINRLTPTRPKRDTQRIADLVRELKQAHEARRNDFIERLKQRKSHRAAHSGSRFKRSATELRDKITEFQKHVQARHAEQHKKRENRADDKKPATPVNNTPAKPKPSPMKIDDLRHPNKFEESRHAAKPEEHHSTKSEEPRHSTKFEELHHPPKSEEPHHTSKTEEHHTAANKTSKSPRRNSLKQKSHVIHRRDLNDNQLGENAGSDLMKDLHFRLFLDPVLNAREDDAPFDPLSSEQFERRKRSLSDNEIFEDEEIDNDSIPHMYIANNDPEFHPVKLARSSDLNKINQDNQDYDTSKPNVSTTSTTTVYTKVDLGQGKISDSTTPKVSFFEYEENDYVTGDSYAVPNPTQGSDLSWNKGHTCQLVKYNVFSYLWCWASKMFYYLI